MKRPSIGNLKTYYSLTKPGIIYGNLLTATGGILLASKGHINFELLLASLIGISLIIASACAVNNYIDRGIDAKMLRTKKRALASGMIEARNAVAYASLLGLGGFLVLALYTNNLTVYLGIFALFAYVVLYSVTKRRSVHGTLVGTVSGALPPVAGYCAVTNKLDGGAVILFLTMVFWQMPHFYAIAIYRLDDYKSAGLPVWPAKKGLKSTKIQILLYIAAFVAAGGLLTAYGYSGYIYLAIMSLLGLVWLRLGLKGFNVKDSKLWARTMFVFSLFVISSFSVLLSLEAWLP